MLHVIVIDFKFVGSLEMSPKFSMQNDKFTVRIVWHAMKFGLNALSIQILYDYKHTDHPVALSLVNLDCATFYLYTLSIST